MSRRVIRLMIWLNILEKESQVSRSLHTIAKVTMRLPTLPEAPLVCKRLCFYVHLLWVHFPFEHFVHLPALLEHFFVCNSYLLVDLGGGEDASRLGWHRTNDSERKSSPLFPCPLQSRCAPAAAQRSFQRGTCDRASTKQSPYALLGPEVPSSQQRIGILDLAPPSRGRFSQQ